jgi:hypothetical protein
MTRLITHAVLLLAAAFVLMASGCGIPDLY